MAAERTPCRPPCLAVTEPEPSSVRSKVRDVSEKMQERRWVDGLRGFGGGGNQRKQQAFGRIQPASGQADAMTQSHLLRVSCACREKLSDLGMLLWDFSDPPEDSLQRYRQTLALRAKEMQQRHEELRQDRQAELQVRDSLAESEWGGRPSNEDQPFSGRTSDAATGALCSGNCQGVI